MKRLQILTIILLTVACESARREGDQQTKGTEESLISPVTNRYSLDDVQGPWGEEPGENAYFLIDGDSVIYIDGDVMGIGVSNDSLIFHYPESPMSFKINWIRNDSMSLMMYGELDTLIRFVK